MVSFANEQSLLHANQMFEEPYGFEDLSYEHLFYLAEENSPESIEQLKVLAEKFNIADDGSISPRDLVMRVWQAQENEDDNEALR